MYNLDSANYCMLVLERTVCYTTLINCTLIKDKITSLLSCVFELIPNIYKTHIKSCSIPAPIILKRCQFRYKTASQLREFLHDAILTLFRFNFKEST